VLGPESSQPAGFLLRASAPGAADSSRAGGLRARGPPPEEDWRLPPKRWQIAKAMQDSFAVRTFFLNYGFTFLRCALPHPPAEQPEQARSEAPHTAPSQGRHLVELRQGPVLGQKIAAPGVVRGRQGPPLPAGPALPELREVAESKQLACGPVPGPFAPDQVPGAATRVQTLQTPATRQIAGSPAQNTLHTSVETYPQADDFRPTKKGSLL